MALCPKVAALFACGFAARQVTERCGYAPLLAVLSPNIITSFWGAEFIPLRRANEQRRGRFPESSHKRGLKRNKFRAPLIAASPHCASPQAKITSNKLCSISRSGE
jgi:hypothetical protein